MSFGLFLAYVFLTFSRPIELFAPELGELRPMLIFWLVSFMAATVHAIKRKEVGARGIHYRLLAGFTLAIAASQVFAGWAGGAFGAVSTFSTSALLFVLVTMNVTSTERLKSTCGVMMMAIVFAACMSTYAYHTGTYAKDLVLQQSSGMHDNEDPSNGPLPDAGDLLIPAQDNSGWYLWRVRGMGFLNDPNDFAQAMVMTLPLIWGLWKQGTWARNLLVVVAPTSLLGYTIFLTQSRGAILGIGSLLFFGIRKRLGQTKTILLVALMGVAGSVVSSMSGRAYSSQEQSASDRIDAWSVGINLLKAHPLFGVGFGNFTEHNPLTAHNSFVLCFSELGLIGFFSWMAMLVFAFKSLSRVLDTLQPDEPEYKMAELLRSALVGFLTCAWFLSRTYDSSLFFVLGLCASAWYCAAQTPTAKQPGSVAYLQLRDVKWVRTTMICVLLAVMAVYFFIISHNLSK
jgi:putative inorganic carbon (HCO3(-)) transporter